MTKEILCPKCNSNDLETIEIDYMKDIKKCNKCESIIKTTYKAIPIKI